MDVREDCLYSEEHHWVRREDDGTVTIGLTDYAQDLLGDLVHVDLPVVGSVLGQGDELAVAESVKAASAVVAPVSGEVVAANDDLGERPEVVNEEPYDGGWLARMDPSEPAELEALLDSEAYRALCEADE